MKSKPTTIWLRKSDKTRPQEFNPVRPPMNVPKSTSQKTSKTEYRTQKSKNNDAPVPAPAPPSRRQAPPGSPPAPPAPRTPPSWSRRETPGGRRIWRALPLPGPLASTPAVVVGMTVVVGMADNRQDGQRRAGGSGGRRGGWGVGGARRGAGWGKPALGVDEKTWSR